MEAFDVVGRAADLLEPPVDPARVGVPELDDREHGLGLGLEEGGRQRLAVVVARRGGEPCVDRVAVPGSLEVVGHDVVDRRTWLDANVEMASAMLTDAAGSAPGVPGSWPSRAGRHTYQSRLSDPGWRDSVNHACSSEVWLTTRSITSFMPRECTAATSSSKSSIVPNMGSMAS